MKNRAIWSNLPFATQIDEENDKELVSSEPTHTAIILDDPPKSPYQDDFQSPSDEEHSSKFMFDDDIAFVGALPLFSTFKSLQNPSSSRYVYNFGLTSYSSEHVDEEIQIDDQVQATLGGENETNPPQGN